MLHKFWMYYKNNPNNYWFKRKLYGWGWTPVKWQGWLVIVLYMIGVFSFALCLNDASSNTDILLKFVLPITILTIGLFYICYKTGEKPRWQWGQEK